MQNSNLKKRARLLDHHLKKLFPHAHCILNYHTPWELLVAVILSAQCTDVTVNKVTEKLFKKYLTLDDYVAAHPRQFEKDIYSTGFFHNKTRHILGAAAMIQKQWNGNVPATMQELLKLPGVARKTANIVLGTAFGIVCGIAVDTHVRRFVRVYGLSHHKNPEKIEKDLMQLLPKKDWFGFTYRAIEYGRNYCPAKLHHHDACPLTQV